MSRLLTTLIASTAMLATPALPQSLNQQQRNLLNHLAQVMVIQNNCPDYDSNDGLIAVMLSHYKLRLSDNTSEAYFKSRYAEHMKGMQIGKTPACLIGWSLYGKGGQNVPDLLVKR